MTTTTKTWTETRVAAEDAPLDVQLWPTRDDERFGLNFTLESVAVVRTINGTHVEWRYYNGNVRSFLLGEHVVISLAS